MPLTADEWFQSYVDSKVQAWTATARQTMLANGEDAVVSIFGEIAQDMDNPVLHANERFKLQLAAIGFARVYQSAFFPLEMPPQNDPISDEPDRFHEE